MGDPPSAGAWVSVGPPVAPLALASAVAMALGAVHAAVGGGPWPGVVHLVAPPPLDLTADLRLLLAATDSVAMFAAGAAASFVARVALLAALLGGLHRRNLWLAGRLVLLLWPVAFVAAALQYAGIALLYLQLFWIGTALAVATVLLVGALPWLAGSAASRGDGGALRSGVVASARSWARLGTIGAALVALAVLGAVADAFGALVAIGLVPVSAALTWLTILMLREPTIMRTPRRALAGLGGVGAGALVVVALAGPVSPPDGPLADVGRDGSLMLMSGIDSSSGSGAVLEIDPGVVGWSCEQTHYFSYAGPGDGQPQNEAACPIRHGAPYEPVDSLRSRDQVIPWLAEQVESMVPPAVIVGHSQGAWFLWEAAAEGRLDGVEAVVLLGMFPSNPVGYAPEPRGDMGRVVIDAMLGLPGAGGQTEFDAASPLGQEWLAPPGSVEAVLARPLPDHIRWLSVPSALDLPAMPQGAGLEGVVDACPVPVVHPDLPYAPEVWETVTAFLDGEPLPPCAPWRSVPGLVFRGFAPPAHG